MMHLRKTHLTTPLAHLFIYADDAFFRDDAGKVIYHDICFYFIYHLRAHFIYALPHLLIYLRMPGHLHLRHRAFI
jgi:hypothetical protein